MALSAMFCSSAKHRMGLDSDDLPSINAWRGSVTDALLIPRLIWEAKSVEILCHGGPTVAVMLSASNLAVTL